MSLRRFLAAILVALLVAPIVRAQDPPQSSSSKHGKKPALGKESTPAPGAVTAGTYRNPAFGFTCKIPAGWVLRTDEMNAPGKPEGDPEDGPQAASAPDKSVGSGRGARVLLAAFSRPPEARAEEVNSSILIAAESAASYPGLNEAVQYFGPVAEVAKAQGLVADEDPYGFVLGTKSLVRGDFHKDVATRVMRQSTLVALARGYVISFTFISGTEGELEELIQSLNFTAAGKPAH